MRRRALLLSPLASLPTAPARTRAATAWPARLIRLVVPYPPGGSPDALCRRIADPMGGALGQPLLVGNRTGAGGTIGRPVGQTRRRNRIGDIPVRSAGRYAPASAAGGRSRRRGGARCPGSSSRPRSSGRSSAV